MPTIRPLRDYSEHEVLPPIFRWNPSGAYPTNKGTFVKIISGACGDDTLQQLGDVGAHYQNVVAQRYGIPAFVGAVTNSGDAVVGMLLYDIREYDENGEKLILHPDKAERMQCTVSGQACVILRRGFVQYSGIVNGTVVGRGEPIYLSSLNNGTLTTSGTSPVSIGSLVSGASYPTQVARAYGPTDSQGFNYIFVDC